MRREDKERQKKFLGIVAQFAATLWPECPPEKRVSYVRSLVPVVRDMVREADERWLKSLSTMKVRFVHRPRLPK